MCNSRHVVSMIVAATGQGGRLEAGVLDALYHENLLAESGTIIRLY